MYRIFMTLVFFSIFHVQYSFAVNVVQCEDQEGNRSFRAYCPPDMTLVGEKNLQTKTHPTPTVTPVVYLAPKCPACEAVRKFFQEREISTEEKNIDGNLELQNELKELVGDLKIPTIVVGDRVLTDYKKADLMNAMMAIGYSELELNK